MSMHPTYAFDESGQVIAFHGNTPIAKGTNFGKVAETAEEYFGALRKEHKKQTKEAARQTATHITTPNGQKGTILTRTAGLWSDEITVRFDNGQIRRFATYAGDDLDYSQETGFGKHASATPTDALQAVLDETYTPSRHGLTERLATLEQIRKEASGLASKGVSYSEGQALHTIVLTADAERNEVREALDYLETADAEAMTPPKMAYTAIEQADIGPSNDWLEVVANDMVAESEAQDFDKLLTEGPTSFVSSLETGTLGHSGVVREMAIDHIQAKTAGIQGDVVNEYRDSFVARTELARKLELSYRKEAAKDELKKEARVVDNTPDEALFL